MEQIRRLTCFGFVLFFVLLSASGASAQESWEEIRKHHNQPPSTTAPASGVTRYGSCFTYDSRRIAYFSNVFTTGADQRNAWGVAFMNFLKQKYGPQGYMISCDIQDTFAAEQTYKQKHVDAIRSLRGTAVETGWKYSGAGSAGTPTSAAAQPAPTHAALPPAQKPDWQNHIDWCIGHHTTDPGGTDCAGQYTATEPKCIAGGGRACLMERAIDAAKHNNCSYAFRLTLICQCHNSNAQQQLGEAGPQKVCDYLKTK